jgi:hypothetical protein
LYRLLSLEANFDELFNTIFLKNGVSD